MCVIIICFGNQPMRNFVPTVVRSRKVVLGCWVRRLRPGLFVHGGEGGSTRCFGWLADSCTTAVSFWVKLLASQFSHIHITPQETWTDLHHLCVAETLVAVPCCCLIFMTCIFRHCDLLILKIISVQAHRKKRWERERVHVLDVCACAWYVCVRVFDILIILSVFVTEKERIRYTYSKIIVFVVLLSLYWQSFLCVILTRWEWESECMNDKSVSADVLWRHIVPPDYTFRLPKLRLCI